MTKVAIVTGAGSGIGRAVSLALVAAGWSVTLAGRRADVLQETAALAAPGSTLVHPADVSDEASVDALFDATKAHFGRLDLLFNNAGVSLPNTLPGDLSASEWRRAVDVNLHGMFFCLSAAFKLRSEEHTSELQSH